MLGLLPTGMGPDDADDVPHVSLYWSLRCEAVDAWRSAGLAAWKDEVLAMQPDAAPVLAQIEDPSQLTLAVYHDVVMRRWHTHNVVVLMRRNRTRPYFAAWVESTELLIPDPVG